jgi:hypothetical protein
MEKNKNKNKIKTITNYCLKWLALNKLLVNQPEAKHQERFLPPRPPENLLQPLVVSRNPTDIDLEPSLFVKSEDTKSPLNF